MEIAEKSTDETTGAPSDHRPQDRRAIVEGNEAMADGRLVGRLMKSFGVFVASPAGGTDAAGHNEHRDVDDPYTGGGTEHSGRAAEDRGTVDLDIGAPDGGVCREALIEIPNRALGFGQSVLKDRPVGQAHRPVRRARRSWASSGG